jgi:hypothetical protein
MTKKIPKQLSETDPSNIITSNTGRELHMVGDSVAVCWNLKRSEKKIKGEDGLTYKAEVWERTSIEPYIDFVRILKNRDEEFYEDDDSSVAGGISLKGAERIRDELTKAIDYLKSL